ncbi:3734_t:CDS:2 [Acaulospora morrowiae]|uniref:3734_t:CDS:1 n=1 Tax=Acaulospora morrowiae TaxID=94023 RepID=A0A9N9FGX3_9GLOM|nr:3734_t:CDS:2 [Acaulospora morrowiae]
MFLIFASLITNNYKLQGTLSYAGSFVIFVTIIINTFTDVDAIYDEVQKYCELKVGENGTEIDVLECIVDILNSMLSALQTLRYVRWTEIIIFIAVLNYEKLRIETLLGDNHQTTPSYGAISDTQDPGSRDDVTQGQAAGYEGDGTRLANLEQSDKEKVKLIAESNCDVGKIKKERLVADVAK